MSLGSKAVNLTLNIQASKETDADEVDRLTRRLRDEIQELNVESVKLVRSENVPSGAKSAEAVTLGALAVAIFPELLPKLMGFLQDWLQRGNGIVKIKTQLGERSLELEYSPRTMSPAQLRGLVETLTRALAEENGERGEALR
jgi:hypothetical protein